MRHVRLTRQVLVVLLGLTGAGLVVAGPAAPGAAARMPEAAPSAVAPAVLAVPLAPAALVWLSRLHEASKPAPPAAAASRRNARRPWSFAIASLPFDLPSVRAPGNKDAVRPLTVV